MPVYKNDETGKWDFKVNYKENGKYKQKMRRGFRTQKEAKAAMSEMENDLNKGTFIEQSKTLYKDFMESFLNDKKMHVKRGTMTTYSSMINNHILPALGHLAISSITPRHIQDFYNDLHSNGKLSDENIQKCHTIINESMKKAASWEMISKNPVSLVERPKARKKEMQVWTLEQAHAFLEASKDDMYYIVFLLALTTGMRKGEILGLRWKDVDFDKRTISITQIMSSDGKDFQVGAKTISGSRLIRVDSETMEALRLHKIRTNEKKMSNKLVYTDLGLVVSTSLGTPVSPRNISRTFDRIIANSKLKKIRFHDLRHSHVTFLIKNRETPQVIAERMGWSDTRMIDNYAHILPDIQEDTADLFGKSFYNKPDTNFDTKVGS
ncbi:tyrosine-type recombinase/integrase [Paenibacillus sp. NRS-1781]|uniref:site-specific integrase n=1 Tax=Paenibacillus sp. NRS-1781 TaxID=3233905 RepID=UPI003D2D8AF5